ncbi:hypothetical protein [Marivirga sp.]|uniref:hypothetical protein n=1 Tax=Marivirga sp. TaxID=2018662 RepID=UPI0025EDCCBF|nr:hypothetical protein [Marivirga sp.]
MEVKKIQLLLSAFFLLLSLNLQGQISTLNGQVSTVERKYSIKIKNDIFRRIFKDGGSDFRFYITDNGESIIAQSYSKFFLIEAATGNVLLEETLPFIQFKKKEKLRGAYGIIKELNLLLFFNQWTEEGSVIKAFDLKTGKKMWENEDARVTTPTGYVVLDSRYANAVEENHFDKRFSPLEKGESLYLNYSTFYPSMKYFEETDALFIRGHKKSYLINGNTGETLWETDTRLITGKAKYFKDRNEYVFVTFSIDKEEGVVFILDAETGNTKRTIDYIGKFNKDNTHFVGGNLVNEYLAIEILDLITGERLALSAEEEGIEFFKKLGSGGGGNNSAIGENVIYGMNSQMGRKVVPGYTGHKSKLLKYDLKTGEKKLEKDIDDAIGMMYADDEKIIGSTGKFNKSYLHKIDGETGEYVWSSEPIKGLSNFKERTTIGSNKTISAGKKELYIIDNETGDFQKTVDLDELNIGNIRRTEKVGDNIFLLGVKGLAFVSKEGEIIGSDKIGNSISSFFGHNIQRAYWNEDYTYVFQTNKVHVFNNSTMESKGFISYPSEYSMEENNEKTISYFNTRVMYLSANGQYFLKVRSNGAMDIFEM